MSNSSLSRLSKRHESLRSEESNGSGSSSSLTERQKLMMHMEARCEEQAKTILRLEDDILDSEVHNEELEEVVGAQGHAIECKNETIAEQARRIAELEAQVDRLMSKMGKIEEVMQSLAAQARGTQHWAKAGITKIEELGK